MVSSTTKNSLSLRKWLFSFVRTHSWLPLATTVLSAGLFVAALGLRSPLLWVTAAGILLAITSYVYGYSARALKYVNAPWLEQYHRTQYEKVWDALAASSWQARWAASGEAAEAGLQRSAARAVGNILDLAKIEAGDDVLEIGCGVGRIGLELAPRCRFWTGVDISGNMLAVARTRLAKLQNVRLVKLDRAGLHPFEAHSFDVAYSTNVFDHLDKTDRWLYIREALRVLREGGRLFIDNTDLESDAGWNAFANGAGAFDDKERPPYTPTPATAAEYMTYARRAGFQQIQVHKRPSLLILTASKFTG